MARIKLSINGAERVVDVAPEMPLLWVLRDILGLVGTKFGCGEAACGACTVLADGEAVRSCVTPVESVAGAAILTIESEHDPWIERLKAAWVAGEVPQCGYCQPGQIMSAAGLLRKHPAPVDDDIDAAMSGNICRCGTYQRIRKAIHAAVSQPQPGEAAAAAPPPSAGNDAAGDRPGARGARR